MQEECDMGHRVRVMFFWPISIAFAASSVGGAL